jgi:hypothetical protein
VPALTTTILRKQLAAGETDPLYMLVGADDLEKSSVAAEFAEMVEEDLRAFNVERIYGGETKVDALIDAASTLPMMAPRRVVVVADAEKLLIPKRESKASDGGAGASRSVHQGPAVTRDDCVRVWSDRSTTTTARAAVAESGARRGLRHHRQHPDGAALG